MRNFSASFKHRRLKKVLLAFLCLALIGASALLAASSALAAETIKYSYDVHGRLVKVERTGTVNNNVVTTYTHDRANNRTNKTTTGAAQ
jgi:YD repeat-containing protein